MVAAILAGLVLMTGFGILVAGATLSVGAAVARDDDGFITSPRVEWRSPGHAVRTPSAEIHVDAGAVDLPQRLLGDVRVTADPDIGSGVFVGIARTALVDRYLAGVAHSVATDAWDGVGVDSRFVDGGAPRTAPQDVGFWDVSASGPDRQTITWAPREGDWTLVVMTDRGTAPVVADVSVGAEAPVVGTVGLVLVVAGLVVAVLGGLGLGLALWRR